jgi:hypothetical protein
MKWTIDFGCDIQQQIRCDSNSKRLIFERLKCYLCSLSRYFINLGLKRNRSIDLNYFRICRFVLFFSCLVFFPPPCLSLEVESWRSIAPVALSATDKFVLIDTCVCSYFYQKIDYINAAIKIKKGYNLQKSVDTDVFRY